jgi:phage gpG-like protein
MAQPEIGVIGLREAIKALESLGVEVTDLKAAWNRVGNIVVTEAKGRVHAVSGALAGSIKANNAKGNSTVKAGSAKVPYAGVQNYGWPAHNIEAQNYLTGAASDKRDEVVQAITDELDNLIAKLDLN